MQIEKTESRLVRNSFRDLEGVRTSDLILLYRIYQNRNNITKESLLSIRVGEPNTNPDVSSYPSSCTHSPIAYFIAPNPI